MDNKYIVYHLHSDYSVLDSTTKFKNYIKKAKELNMKAIGFSEHGNIFNWVKKKQECDLEGIKYMHGAEFYLTENLENKIRDNYHTIIYAKNIKGVLELNSLISLSNNTEHFYYKPRISFDEFLNISDNLISISACLASPLNKLSKDSTYYNKLINKYDFLEIQPHFKSKEQKDYNIFLYEISKTYNKKLIMGTDTHELNRYKQECRAILKKAKKMEYDNEDDFNLTFRSFDDLIEECLLQNCFDISVYMEAINNTNFLAEMIEDFKLDKSFKYPKLYSKEEEYYINIVTKKLNEKVLNNVIEKDKLDIYKKHLNDEFDAFKKQGMFGYMLFISELTTWCWENNIPIGYARGSVSGSVSAYILDITDVDPIRWDTIFSRFCNKDRVSLADVDLDFSPEDRVKVFKYIEDRFGDGFTSFIVTFNSISEKGVISEITRALDYDFKKSMDIKSEFENNEELCRNKYPDVFKYYDGLIGTYISVGIHPAGKIGSPISLNDNIGFYYSEGRAVSQCDMKAVDSLNYVKFDILGLKNIGIIRETYKLLNQNYKKSHEINWNDENVWEDITSSPSGLFQFESQYSFDLLKKFKPKHIDDLSLINASLRPSGDSYRDKILNKEFNYNPTKEIDELLKNNYGFLVYQEDSIKFLQEICGMSGSEADTVRRAIGKKDIDLLNKMLPKVKEGYVKNSKQPSKIAENEVLQFIQILSDSSDYQFSYNHATSYSMIGYTCAYLRYYHPLEFITAFLNMSETESDFSMGQDLSKLKNIEIRSITFGKSDSIYNIKNGVIYKGMKSVKYINNKIPEELNRVYEQNINSFPLLYSIIKKETSINSRQIEVLIKINYFKEYGSIKKLWDFVEFYNKLSKKTYKKEGLDEDLEKYIKKYSIETPNMYKLIDKDSLMEEYFNNIPNEEFEYVDIIRWQNEYLGYISDIPENISLGKVQIISSKHKSLLLQSLRNNKEQWFKIKSIDGIKKGSIILIQLVEKKKRYDKINYHIEKYEII